MNTGNLRVRQWALHEVPNHPRGGGGEPLGLSDDVSPYSDEVARYLDLRISGSLGRAAREVEERTDAGSMLVPDTIRRYFASDVDLLTASKELAAYLYSCQAGNVSSGLLVVADATDQSTGDAVLALLKLEPQDGVRAKRTTDSRGRIVYNIDYVPDLMLTQKTKVFKVAVFSRTASASTPLTGFAVDDQLPRSSHLANFFLRTFLGCDLRDRDDVVTERFLRAGEDFAKSLPPESKPKFVAAMQSELGSNRATVAIDSFATNHIDTTERARFKEQMRERKVPNRFRKDNELVARYLQRVQMTVDDGSVVITPTENLDRSVRISELDGGNSRIEITGRITGTRSRGSR